jgi:hypothetical protein
VLSGYCATSVGIATILTRSSAENYDSILSYSIYLVALAQLAKYIALKDSAWCTAAKSLDSLRKPIGSNEAAWSVLSVLSEV